MSGRTEYVNVIYYKDIYTGIHIHIRRVERRAPMSSMTGQNPPKSSPWNICYVNPLYGECLRISRGVCK